MQVYRAIRRPPRQNPSAALPLSSAKPVRLALKWIRARVQRSATPPSGKCGSRPQSRGVIPAWLGQTSSPDIRTHTDGQDHSGSNSGDPAPALVSAAGNREAAGPALGSAPHRAWDPAPAVPNARTQLRAGTGPQRTGHGAGGPLLLRTDPLPTARGRVLGRVRRRRNRFRDAYRLHGPGSGHRPRATVSTAHHRTPPPTTPPALPSSPCLFWNQGRP